MANYVKFMRGTVAAYNQLETKEQNTLYFLYSSSPDEEGYLYLGNKLISQPDNTTIGASTLATLTDVLISEGLNTEAILVYNPSLSKWESQSFESLIFQGADSTHAGLSGMVPAPQAGQENLFLRGDGTWASVGAGTSVFEIETNANETHIAAINRITTGVVLASGDIAIVKDFIINGKFQYTAYVRSGSQWIAMDGNYNAENVYFKDNLIFTEAVGAIEIPASGSVEIASEGKNLKQVMELIFAKEKNPVITNPSIEVSINDKRVYEVGTKVTPQYIINFNKGNYEFGPDTGVQATSYSVTATGYEGAALTTQEGEFDEIIVQDDTEYYITASVKHSAGSIPVTNLNNEFIEGKIAATVGQPIVQSSLPIIGYRSYFYGMDNTNDTIDNNFVRNKLINGGPYDGQKKIEFNASEMRNVKRFIIAIPEASTRSGIVSAHITTSMYANVLKEYRTLGTNVLVEGVDGYTSAPYKIWIYEPASIASSEIHEVILS